MQSTLTSITRRPIARRLPRVGLLDWLDAPRPEGGLHFATDDGDWEFWAYPRLARLVAEAAARIESERTRDSGPVSIALPAVSACSSRAASA